MPKKKLYRNKKAIEMTFNWIFAILVGGFILFIAIYGASKFIRTSEQTVYTETAASLVSLFDPLETGLASGKSSEISFKKQSRLTFDCNEHANLPFGKQTISFSEQTFGKEFGESGGKISIKDKYVFTESILKGKKIYYFSKPFFMGFKVSDVLMLYSDQTPYCLYNAPDDVKDDIESLNLPHILFLNSSLNCEGIKICFITGKSGGNCDIRVFTDEHYIIKDGQKLYFKDNLLYAALFSSPSIYECNIQRIKHRYDALGTLYLEKIKILERKTCEPQLGPKLAASIHQNITNSRDLLLFFNTIEDIDSINQRAKDGCKLYYNINFN